MKSALGEHYTETGNAACQQKGVYPVMASYHRVTGSLQVQRGQWVVRARVYDPKTGKKPQRAKVTGLKAPGNKRAAQQIMKEIVAQWEKEANTGIAIGDPLFSEYVQKWLENKKDVRANTLKSYHDYARVHILPALGDLKVRDMTVQQREFFLHWTRTPFLTADP